MDLFDKLKNKAAEAVNQAAGSAATKGSKTVQVGFASMPESLAEFAALPQAQLSMPFETAALFAAALCVYPLNKDECVAMINYLKGPEPLGVPAMQFLATRMAQNKKAGYLGASYFDGATPANEYAPTKPYTVSVSENPHSYATAGYAKLFLKSGGADSPRPVAMRQAKDGKWYLWEYSSILLDIVSPESTNAWSTRGFR